MILSVISWIPKAVGLIILTLVAFVISPLLACFIVYAEESSITGQPSLLPNTPRAFLIPVFRIWQTPDAPVDEFWYGDYQGFPKDGKTQADYDKSIWLRWLCRVVWLWRNAAYGFGANWGYTYAPTLNDGANWNSGKSCTYFWKVTNDLGQIGWCLKFQWFYTASRYIVGYLGYKLQGDSIKGKKFVAIQFNPFRTV